MLAASAPLQDMAAHKHPYADAAGSDACEAHREDVPSDRAAHTSE